MAEGSNSFSESSSDSPTEYFSEEEEAAAEPPSDVDSDLLLLPLDPPPEPNPYHPSTSLHVPSKPPLHVPPAIAAPFLTAFTTFLTLSIHSLLYHRGLYPTESFTSVRAFNLAVHQSRHPGVCTWVNDAITAVTAQLRSASVSKIVFVIHAPADRKFQVLERWIFDVSSFPVWGSLRGGGSGGGGEEAAAAAAASAAAAAAAAEAVAVAVAEEDEDEDEDDAALTEGFFNRTNANQAFRGALSRIASKAERLSKVPSNCTFTLAVELREESQPPIGHPQHWIPAQKDQDEQHQQQPEPENGTEQRRTSITTLPVRSVRAGILFFECWVEQSEPSKSSEQEPQQPSSKAVSGDSAPVA